MADFYPKASYYRDPDGEEYDFKNAPALVVINLGTNDRACGSTEEGYKKGAKKLIEYIRYSYNKDIPIVWVHNMMGDGKFDWAKSVLDSLGGENNGIYALQLDEDHTGANGHPCLEAQKKAADALADFIEAKGILAE